MIKKEIINQPKEVVTDVICDCCGKSCNTEYGPEYMKLEASWGFMSNHDLENWSAQICEECVIKQLQPLIEFHKISSIGGREL